MEFNILGRSRNRLTLMFKQEPSELGYRILAANSLDNAYGNLNGVTGTGVQPLFTVGKGAFYRSKSVIEKTLPYSARDRTYALIDPDDFFGLHPAIPNDAMFGFYRFQVRTLSNPVFPAITDNLSPIHLVATPDFFTMPRPTLTLGGTAPTIGGLVNGGPIPPEALHMLLPAYGDSIILTNLGGNPLFVSMGKGMPMIEIPAGEQLFSGSGVRDSVYLAASGVTTYSMMVSIVNGIR